jgi:hypothetical protein
MMQFWRALFAFFFAPLCIGGSSESRTTTSYNTTDSRVAGGAEGSVAVGSGGAGVGSTSNNIQSSGAVTINSQNATEFARLLDTLDRANALQGQTLTGLLHSADGIAQIAQAAESERTNGLDTKTIALLAVIGIVGIVVVVKFKG